MDFFIRFYYIRVFSVSEKGFQGIMIRIRFSRRSHPNILTVESDILVGRIRFLDGRSDPIILTVGSDFLVGRIRYSCWSDPIS